MLQPSCTGCTNVFCRSLSPDSRKLLLAASKRINFSAQIEKPFYFEDQQIIILEKGALIGYRSDVNLRLQSVDLLQPGDLLGIANLFSQSEREAFSIKALIDSFGCSLPIQIMEQLIVERPDIAKATICQYSSRYSRVVDSFINKTNALSEERVIYALNLLKKLNVKKITHENLALLSGMNRVTVTKALHHLYPIHDE